MKWCIIQFNEFDSVVRVYGPFDDYDMACELKCELEEKFLEPEHYFSVKELRSEERLNRLIRSKGGAGGPSY